MTGKAATRAHMRAASRSLDGRSAEVGLPRAPTTTTQLILATAFPYFLNNTASSACCNSRFLPALSTRAHKPRMQRGSRQPSPQGPRRSPAARSPPDASRPQALTAGPPQPKEHAPRGRPKRLLAAEQPATNTHTHTPRSGLFQNSTASALGSSIAQPMLKGPTSSAARSHGDRLASASSASMASARASKSMGRLLQCAT